MVRAKKSERALDQKALRSLGQSDDLDQPYDRIRELAPDERDPHLTPALDPRDGRCAMHRLKEQILSRPPTLVDAAGALRWIETMEASIARGERTCRCAR